MVRLNQVISEHLEKVKEISGYLWNKGWVERNGGNISINLTGLQTFESGYGDDRIIMAPCPKKSAGMCLFVTSSGERLRDLSSNMERVAMIIRVCADATGYEVLWGGENDGKATSELESHLKLHLAAVKNKSKARSLLHCHPGELLSASYHPEFQENKRDLNKVLWSMLPEVRIFVPRGVAVLPYSLPGSSELAALSSDGFKDHDVLLWSKHGALAMGEDIIEAFDFIDVLNKGADILLKCLGAGFFPEGLSDAELLELEETYLHK